MSETLKKRGLVAGHADFAAGLIGAVEMISGCGNVLIPIQVRGLCGDDIQKLLYDTCMESGVRVIFTDLQAGSCTMASRRVLKQLGEGVLVAGANLPMLLDFAMSSNESAIEAASTAAERGRVAITVHGAPA
jgi:PTS system N-acetylgalactosamine-specific IIA component